VNKNGSQSTRKCFSEHRPDPDDLQKLMVTSLSKDTSLVKVSWRSDHVSTYVKLIIDRQRGRQWQMRPMLTESVLHGFLIAPPLATQPDNDDDDDDSDDDSRCTTDHSTNHQVRLPRPVAHRICVKQPPLPRTKLAFGTFSKFLLPWNEARDKEPQYRHWK